MTSMKSVAFTLIILLFYGLIQHGLVFDFSWEIDETLEGAESTTIVEPVRVVLLDEAIAVPSYSASLKLMQKYSVHLGTEWSPGHAYRLLQIFKSVPQRTNNPYEETPELPVFRLSDTLDISSLGVALLRDGNPTLFSATLPL